MCRVFSCLADCSHVSDPPWLRFTSAVVGGCSSGTIVSSGNAHGILLFSNQLAVFVDSLCAVDDGLDDGWTDSGFLGSAGLVDVIG